jgi:spermidine synthase
MLAQRSGASVLLAFVFLCSGAIALVYEVIWQRQFALLFGSGAPATAMVLAAYFAGLGLGSFLFGRCANRWTSPLSTYAVLEFAIALGALLVVPVLSIYENWYPPIVSSFGQNSMGLLAIKGLLASAAILIPTTAMGGTLPVLAELVDRGKQHLGLTVGWLYVVNTAGAALGAISVPILLLPTLGTKRTVFLCAAANGLIGVVALGLRKFWKSEATTTGTKSPKPTRDPTQRARPLLALAFASGAGIFTLQVLWNRAFAQIHENSIYSFASIVTVFILAIALGAQAARWLLRTSIRFERALAVAWVLGGLAVAFCPVLFVQLTDGLNYLRGDARNSLGNLLTLGGTLMLLPTALLAAGLPLLMERAGSIAEQSAGHVTGRLLGINIIGSIAGALLAGFVLPKLLGLWNAMIAVGAAFACIGAWVFCKSTTARIVGTATMILLALLLIPRLRDDLPKTHLDVKRGEHLLAAEEGAYGIVAVTERADSRRLKLNNHYTLGGTFATGDERVQAHLPLLIHPHPQRVAFLGFGTGITAGGALFHPGVKIDAVELVPEVSRLASRYFAEANGSFQTQTNTRMILEDARNFLRGSRAKYDVIISDIVVPWQQGEAALYTREHFAAAKRALNTNGLFCAWLPAFQLGETQFHILLRTFVSVFGAAQVWRGDFSPNRPAVALIACDRQLDASVIQRRISEMIADPTNPHLRDPRAFWMHFVGVVRNEDIHEQRINSEDRPWLELHPLRGETAAMTGRKLIEWSRSTASVHAETITQLSPEAASGYQGGRVMVEFTQATFENDRQRAAEMQARLREVVGEETFRLLFGVQ